MTVDIDINRREDIPSWLGYGTPVVTVLVALVIGAIPLVLIDTDPVVVYEDMFIGTLTDTDGIIDVVVRTVPLLLAGLAVYIPLKAGLWNIAVEGQLYLGGIMATWVAISFSAPIYLLIPAMMVAAGVAGAVSGAVPAYLRAKYDINEIIVTLMITFAAIELNEYMIRGPLQGDTGVAISPPFSDAARIPTVGDTSLHYGAVLIVIAVLATYYFIRRSSLGYQTLMVGSGPGAAESSPINRYQIYMLTMIIGGVIAAVAGMVEISGVHGRLNPQWSPEYGFIAIPIALLGLNGAFRVLLASMFFALLFVGGNSIAVTSSVPFSIINVLIALIFLFLITSEFFKKFEVNIRLDILSGGGTDE